MIIIIQKSKRLLMLDIGSCQGLVGWAPRVPGQSAGQVVVG
ncbi:hypothetical protein [Xanthomonas arboricola]|nr:hypothetical protein [Xanthomonas arboricola]